MRSSRVLLVVSTMMTASACGLVIDPDKLVADRDKVDPSSNDGGGPDGMVNAHDANGAVDASFDGNFPTIDGCVPVAPAGTEGPYAVVSTGPFVPFVICPAGYDSTPVVDAKGNPSVPPAECANAGSCTCGSATGTASCSLQLRTFDKINCVDEKSSKAVTTTCMALPSDVSLRVDVIAAGISCPASGSATPTSKAGVTFASQSLACKPNPVVQQKTCAANEVNLPPTTNARACVISQSGTCPSPYSDKRTLARDGTLDDTRGCQCTCETNPAACGSGSVEAYSGNTCDGSQTAIGPGTCKSIGSNDSIRALSMPSPTGSGGCTAKATPIGTATPANTVVFCCLP